MGQDEAWGRELDSVHEEQVEVESARCPAHTVRGAPRDALELLKTVEEREREELGFELRHRVHVPGLTGIPEGLGPVQRRGAQPTEPCQVRERRGHLRRGIPEIRPQTDIGDVGPRAQGSRSPSMGRPTLSSASWTTTSSSSNATPIQIALSATLKSGKMNRPRSN